MGVGGESAGPGNVAVADRIEGVAAFRKGPTRAGVEFAEGEEVGGDILIGTRKAFFSDGELIHEGEAEVLLFPGEIDSEKTAAKAAGSFPTDLTAEAGFIACAVKFWKFSQEEEKDSFEEVPIFGASGEESAEAEDWGCDFVDIDDGEVALTGGGDVEA
jgi:hypothetical protein